MIDNISFSRKADHYIIAELVSKTNIVKDVLTELYLPQNDNEEIFLICKPNAKQYTNLIREFEFSINGYDEFSDGNINNKFHVNRAFRKKNYPTIYTSKLEDFTIVMQAYDLIKICERDNDHGKSETEGYFTIFNRFQIPPLKHLLRKPNGEATFEPYEKYSFMLESGLKLSFDTYYKYENTEDYVKSFPLTVAKFRTDLDPEKINEYITEIDDYLLLLSFALGKMCVCTGWFAASNSKIVTYFRRDKVIPDKDEKHTYPDYLIEPFELKIFLKKSYKAFINFNERELLRNILFPLIRKKRVSVETHFLILFAILESVVLYYKRNNDYEFILLPNDFNTLKSNIKEFIKSNLLSVDKNRRKYMYEKLAELNRISFKSSFELFQKHCKVYVDDLWPLIDSQDGTSLTQIRNKIIHGEIFINHHFQAISLAAIHLQIIVERIIFTLLGWDISNTRVSLEYVREYYLKDFEKVKYYQKLLNE